MPLILLAGCVSGPELKIPAAMPPNAYLALAGFQAHPGNKGVLVFGQVRASRSRARPVNAHLHIAGTFRDGTPPVSTDTNWGTMPVQGSRLASFSALLRTEHPELIDRVTVELRMAPDERD